MAFVTPVMEHWLEREIAQWVHHEGSIQRPIAPFRHREYYCVCLRERERERCLQREMSTERERQRQTERKKDRHRETERLKEIM